MTERKPPGMSFETWVDAQIAAGMERGDFDGLSGSGKPLPRRAAELPSEAAVRALGEDYNARVREFWRRPQESRWSPVPGLADVEELVGGWLTGRPVPAPPAVEPPPAARRWWRRRRS